MVSHAEMGAFWRFHGRKASDADLRNGVALGTVEPMQVLATNLKPRRGQPMTTVGALELVAGTGIVSDANASALSPRQILLASISSYLDGALPAGTLRENVLVDFDVEQFKSGDVLAIGTTARIRLTYLCETCHKLPVDASTVATLHGRRGFLGRVIESGRVRAGDVIAVERARYAQLPNRVRERVFDLVANVPRGRVVDYLTAIIVLGLPSIAYARVLPRLLTTAPPEVPIHRMVASGLRLITAHVPRQHELLCAEGVSIRNGVVLNEHAWQAAEYFGDVW